MKKLNVLTALVFIIVLIINTGAQETEKTLKFKKGESSAVVAGSLLRGEEVSYILKANKDQNMVVTISSTENNAVFRIKDRTSRYYLDGAGEIDDAIKWQGSLPSDGEYKIIIGGTRGNTEYTLKVYIE
jgi:hypothetical protein